MSNRFTRDYKLTIGIGSKQVIITPPFNITFSITENILNRSLNKMNMKIMGLQQSTREKLVKYELNKEIYLPIKFEVGYKGKMYQAFKGSVRIGENSREGATFASNLECYDGHPDYTEAFTAKTVKGRALSIDAILEDMPNTSKGTVTTLAETLRPKVLIGPSSELLAKIAQGKEFYIKDEKIYIIDEQEVVSSVVPVVNAKSGLKTAPVQDHIDTSFTTVLNPALKIGQRCVIESITNPAVNGTYKIYQIVTSGSYKLAWEQTGTCRKDNSFTVIK